VKITIGVPTYNRKNMLETMAKSLYASNMRSPYHIRIYDDCSTDYGTDYLKALFPDAVSIRRNAVNVKADKNMYEMYKDFLTTDDDVFFNADSDLLFQKGWLEKALNLLEKTDGILSIFNTASHPSVGDVSSELHVKDAVGAAGTMFKRPLLEKLIAGYVDEDECKHFDWKWSEYFRSSGYKIYCATSSLVQHIGYVGQNAGYYFDVGSGFKVDSAFEGQVLNDVFVNYVNDIRFRENIRYRKEEMLNNDFLYHFTRCIKISVKRLLPKPVSKFLKTLLAK
jgi:glycosyltransferase involved in cell wall biosynthesis